MSLESSVEVAEAAVQCVAAEECQQIPEEKPEM